MVGYARGESEGAEVEVEAVEETEEEHSSTAAVELGLTSEVISKLDGEQLQLLLRERELTRRESAVARATSLGPDVVAPTGMFIATVIIVFLPLFFRWRREQVLHQTLRAMVEKGVEIPLELITPQRSKANDLRRGVILVGLGVGLSLFLALLPEVPPGVWAAGLIPALMGAGYLIVWRLQPEDPDAHSPPHE
jgi:hypothetical protein